MLVSNRLFGVPFGIVGVFAFRWWEVAEATVGPLLVDQSALVSDQGN